MTIFADQERSNPDRPGLTRLLPKLPHSAGWMLLVNLLLGSLFFLELQWYLEHVYRFSPWIPFLSYERVHTVIDVLWGAFMLHVGAPLARGKLEILTAPEKFLGKEAFGLFSHRTTAAGAAALVGGLYALITFSPALHLTHTSTGDPPVVVIDGSRRQFEGPSIPLLGRDMDVNQAEVVVSGRHRFLRVNLDPIDVETYRLFPTHKHVDLDRLFLRRDLVATLYDAHERELAAFTFQHENDLSITRQCGESDIQGLFPDDPRACVTLMRRIVADMSANSDARLLRDFEGSVEYKGRIYGYDYAFGPEHLFVREWSIWVEIIQNLGGKSSLITCVTMSQWNLQLCCVMKIIFWWDYFECLKWTPHHRRPSNCLKLYERVRILFSIVLEEL